MVTQSYYSTGSFFQKKKHLKAWDVSTQIQELSPCLSCPNSWHLIFIARSEGNKKVVTPDGKKLVFALDQGWWNCAPNAARCFGCANWWMWHDVHDIGCWFMDFFVFCFSPDVGWYWLVLDLQQNIGCPTLKSSSKAADFWPVRGLLLQGSGLEETGIEPTSHNLPTIEDGWTPISGKLGMASGWFLHGIRYTDGFWMVCGWYWIETPHISPLIQPASLPCIQRLSIYHLTHV